MTSLKSPPVLPLLTFQPLSLAPLRLSWKVYLALLYLWLTVLIMCARIPISLDTCKGLCPLFHRTQTHSHILTQLAFTITHKHTHRPTFTHASTHCLTQRDTNALETNYQSGVSSYIYLGQWGANKRFYSSFLPSVCLFFILFPFHFYLLIFFSLSLSLSFSLSTRHCWGKGFTGCVQCQIQWKTAKDMREKKKCYAAVKSDRSKGMVLCQAAAASFTYTKWSLAVISVM